MDKLIFTFFGFKYIDLALLIFIAKILVFFAVLYLASYITNLSVLKIKVKKTLAIIFLVIIQISFYFLLNMSRLLIIHNLLHLMTFTISWWVLIGKHHFPNYYTDSIICIVSIVFEFILIVVYAIDKVKVRTGDSVVIFGFLGFVSVIVTLYFFRQLWTKYLKIILINKILTYINAMKAIHSDLFENNLSVVLFSQSVFVLFSIAFSVDSSIMIRKILLIFKKHNIKQNFNFVLLIELDNIIKWLQMYMLVNKRSEKELKIIVNGYQRELLN
ncbi:hypothetical protein S100390_v1c09340 [Spiroplasma sp. NBRC 100390]|uniref:hypothetical protein n=1 Tax=unclassified Spiroplasma TaxID=2637901 RepID=UPI0008927EB7|nr:MULTISPECIES: hypothetical protein [unclassified Spiroplasma]AOX44270.1 hypothetical protein STU14_v1c09340 [Spiroplasma sp. TU-14]APE13740.1 hypothetical protein S100390_v1c09340 [Spiroplasma sp. NBRC 100390]